MKKKQLNIDAVEQKIENLSTKYLKPFIKYSDDIYKLGIEFFNLIPLNYNPKEKGEPIIILFITRSLENLRSTILLIKKGYISQAASISANNIEIFLLTRKLILSPKAVSQYLNGQRWAITGRHGLTNEFNLPLIEKIYSQLSSIKHTQIQTLPLNYLKSEYISAVGTGAWSPSISAKIIGANISSVGDVLRYGSKYLSTNFDLIYYQLWEKKLTELQKRIKEYYKKINNL